MQECGKVYAVERNPEKLEYAKKNCELYGVDNVEFILGDALSPETRDKLSDSDIIFSDPARPLTEKERTLDNLEPPITELIKLYSGITKGLAFHAPPQMPPERIGLDCEKEYMSLNGQLNRLTLYFGDLKRCERSAVVLPGNAYLPSSDASAIETGGISEYVYEPEPSVVKAGLLGELAGTISGSGNDIYFYTGNERRTLLTSSSLIESPFFKDRYRVAGKTLMDISKIKAILAAGKAGKVVLRLDVAPDKYWQVRNELEKGLTGSKSLHLFGFGDEVIVCEKIKD
ncbi:MAG: methyltransferase domain-containing protein [Candidatus Methanoperedens sp.]|nr:methyltransferase domain-containing protein [Candidatus Methanoperedens sp.]PKL53830.1 MAG: methyltransferase [Candidatus Methanoperedenaceae archaeon HGW-Methanoperedenaceae-1]